MRTGSHYVWYYYRQHMRTYFENVQAITRQQQGAAATIMSY